MSARPILKWAGGKRTLALTVIEALGPMTPEQRYVEPFLGGGAVFFELWSRHPRYRPHRAVLADVNAELMNVYFRVVRDCNDLIAELQEPQYRYNRDAYYAIRANDPGVLLPIKRAARTIYLNRYGFNGLYRVNGRGQFNVPFGRYDNPKILDPESLYAASEVLGAPGVTLCACAYDEVEYSAGDVVYMDPPYMPVSKTSSFTSYQKTAFGEKEQRKLAVFAERLIARGIRVVLSNSNAPLIRDIYKKDYFEIREVQAARSINSKGEKRSKVTELLIVGRS